MVNTSAGSEGEAERPLETLIDEAAGDSDDGDELSVAKVIERIGHRGFGPLLTLPALIALLPPVGGIPGVPTLMGIIIFLLSVQLLFGKDHPWIPGWIANRSVDRDKLTKASKKAKTVFGYIDKLISPRLEWMTGETGKRLAALACCFLALLMPPLELIPFGVAAPAAVVVLFGIALTSNDGLWMMAGVLLFVVAAILLGPQVAGAIADLVGGGG